MPDMRPALVLTLLIFAVPAAAEPFCENEYFRIDARFEGGQFDECRFRRKDSVVLTIYAENEQVSGAFSWFAFRATAPEARDLRVKLRFPNSYARFWPKVSDDGTSWSAMSDNAVRRGWRDTTMRVRVTADADGTFVSAQELITMPWYATWFDELEAHPDLDVSEAGRSVEGRPIRVARSEDKPEVVLLLGRQHPVEIPGALAMRAFTDVVLGDSELARRFRDRYALLILPLMNPDGVVNGHARHNSGETDLNRDWGPFTQPETQAVAQLLDELDEASIKPKLMLDFHATRMTPTMIFYTQMPDDNTDPPLFASTWLSRAQDRIQGYDIEYAPREPSGQANAKNYFFARYGIPAITYEIGDEADRGAIDRYTPILAEEMMRVLLAAK